MTDQNLQQEEQEDLSDVDDGDLIGSEVKTFHYDGEKKEKKIKSLKQFKIADSLEKLELRYNQIETIEKIKHLKKLLFLDLGFNQIREIKARCFEGLNITELDLKGN